MRNNDEIIDEIMKKELMKKHKKAENKLKKEFGDLAIEGYNPYDPETIKKREEKEKERMSKFLQGG